MAQIDGEPFRAKAQIRVGIYRYTVQLNSLNIRKIKIKGIEQSENQFVY